MGARPFFQSPDARREKLRKDRERRDLALANSLPFIGPAAGFTFGPGFNLLCGQPGSSKSTTAANIVAGAVEYSKVDILVLSNEETCSAVTDRVACILTHTPFQKFYHKKLTGSQQQAVEKAADLVADRVQVLDYASEQNMQVVEDVESVITSAASKFGLVVFDYVQNVTTSREHPHMTTMEISKRLGFFLKDLSQTYPVPLIAFAQIRPKAAIEEMSERIQNDKTLYNHALSVMEIIPDYETRETTFKVHKDRFGPMQGKEVTLRFREGWYECGGDII